MTRRVLSLLAFSVFLSGACFAQDTATGASSVSDQIAAIQKEFEEARQEFMTAYRKLETDEERQKLFVESYPKPETYAPRLLTIAIENEGDPAVVDALTWIVTNVQQGREKKVATEKLIANHIDSPALGPVCFSMIYSQGRDADETLAKILEESPHHDVQGNACFALAERKARSGANEEAIALYRRVIDEYSDVTGMRGGKLADSAEGAIFEAENLSVGKMAPEVEGHDVDGVAFKLSDYRGKVVFLDFWGDW